MKEASRSLLLGIVFLLVVLRIGWASPVDDFKVAIAALDRGDYVTALQLLLKLAKQDLPGAKAALGTMYFEGKGVPKDYAIALSWHRQAAEQGHAFSQYEIGAMYDGGFGVRKDSAEAIKWFQRAAAQGYGRAQFNLGAMYSAGDGVQRNHVEAYKWFSVAALGGGPFDTQSNLAVKNAAAGRRDVIARQMSSEQLRTAQNLARNFTRQTEQPAPSLARPSSEPEKSEADNKPQRDQFREAGVCVAYWRIANNCLHVIAAERTQEARLYFDMLIETMNDRLSELGREAQLSPDAQQRFVEITQQSMFSSVGGKCDGFVKLIPTYRDSCAELFKSHAARVKDSFERRHGR
jgi:hypothetical protein